MAEVFAGVGRSVQLFSDFACPFCYLAEADSVRLAAAGHAVEYRSYELRPQPVPLEAPGDDAAKRYGWERMIEPMAAEAGLSMRFPAFGVRTRKAHEAARYARSHGMERAMRDALFAAYFTDGRDIGRIDVLVSIGEALGLDRTDLKVNLDIDQYTDEVVADEAFARRAGLEGVPAYVIGEGASRKQAVGLQPYDQLLKWVEATK